MKSISSNELSFRGFYGDYKITVEDENGKETKNVNKKKERDKSMRMKKILAVALSVAMVFSLAACGKKDEGKNPNPMVKGMSWMKTNMKLVMNESDHTIADLITDGCNMGVKSLNKYLNQYKAADEVSKDITKRLINLEEKLAIDIRQFL